MATLVIYVDNDASGVGLELQGFPFRDGQFIEAETPNGAKVRKGVTVDTTKVVINMGDYDEVTAAQDQYLNTNDYVSVWEMED